MHLYPGAVAVGDRQAGHAAHRMPESPLPSRLVFVQDASDERQSFWIVYPG